MKISSKLLILLAIFSYASSAFAQSSSPEAVANDFVKAWNSHDMKAFDRVFTDDAIWVPVAEARVEGRNNIVKDLTEIHTTWAKTTTIRQSVLKVQMLRPDVAVVLFHLKYVEDGKDVPGIDRAMVIVAIKQNDGWRIATGQITKQHEDA
jgi:uncharacterized protein (TIGR02246 family)